MKGGRNMEFISSSYKQREISKKMYIDNLSYKGELKKGYHIFSCSISGRDLVVFKDQKELLKFMLENCDGSHIIVYKLLTSKNNKYRYQLDMAHSEHEYVYTVACARVLDLGTSVDICTYSGYRDIVIS